MPEAISFVNGVLPSSVPSISTPAPLGVLENEIFAVELNSTFSVSSLPSTMFTSRTSGFRFVMDTSTLCGPISRFLMFFGVTPYFSPSMP